jgi:tetratricopeptide (TPR) repeat protein
LKEEIRVNVRPESEQPIWTAFVSWQMAILLVAVFVVWFTTAPGGILGIKLASLWMDKKQAMDASSESILTDVDKMTPPGSPQGPSISEMFERGQTNAALQAARQLLNNNQYDVKTLMCAGNIFSQVPESSNEGFDLLRRSVQLAPQSRWVHLNYARKLAQAKRYEEAIPEYKKLAALNVPAAPTSDPISLVWKPAVPVAAENDNWTTPRYELAQLYLDLHQFGDAAQTLRDALAVDGKNGAKRKQLGLALAADNKLDEGFKEFEQAVSDLQGYPSDVEDVMQKNGDDPTKALADLRSMIAASPQDSDLKLDEARLLIANKKYDEAKTVLEAMLKEDKDDADAHLVLAEVYVDQHNSDLAKTELAEAARLIRETDVESSETTGSEGGEGGKAAESGKGTEMTAPTEGGTNAPNAGGGDGKSSP